MRSFVRRSCATSVTIAALSLCEPASSARSLAPQAPGVEVWTTEVAATDLEADLRSLDARIGRQGLVDPDPRRESEAWACIEAVAASGDPRFRGDLCRMLERIVDPPESDRSSLWLIRAAWLLGEDAGTFETWFRAWVLERPVVASHALRVASYGPASDAFAAEVEVALASADVSNLVRRAAGEMRRARACRDEFAGRAGFAQRIELLLEICPWRDTGPGCPWSPDNCEPTVVWARARLFELSGRSPEHVASAVRAFDPWARVEPDERPPEEWLARALPQVRARVRPLLDERCRAMLADLPPPRDGCRR